MREGAEDLLAAEYQPQPSREPCRSAAVPPWFAFSSHIPNPSFVLATFPQCAESLLPRLPVLALGAVNCKQQSLCLPTPLGCWNTGLSHWGAGLFIDQGGYKEEQLPASLQFGWNGPNRQ